MTQFCGAHRAPRAGIDPIDRPRRPRSPSSSSPCTGRSTAETIALVLDADHRGRTVVVVDGTDDPDSVLDVVERLADSIAVGRARRRARRGVGPPGRGPLPGDGDRWLEASDARRRGRRRARSSGSSSTAAPGRGTAWCPRDLLGEPPRWRARSASPSSVCTAVERRRPVAAAGRARRSPGSAAGRRRAGGAPARGSRPRRRRRDDAGRCSSGMS